MRYSPSTQSDNVMMRVYSLLKGIMVTTDNIQRILEAIAQNRKNYPSDAKHAAALGISASVYNSLKKGQTDS